MKVRPPLRVAHARDEDDDIEHHDRSNVPVIVRDAEARCRALGFDQSCRPETGRLLQACVSSFTRGTMLELGTGCGYGTAWMASGLRTDTGARLLTIDLDGKLAASTGALFADWSGVEVHVGEWRAILKEGPFQLIFVDAADAKSTGIDEIVDSLAPGGLILLDDLTPVEHWPEEWCGKPDPIRDIWLHHPELSSAERRVPEDHAVIIGTKR